MAEDETILTSPLALVGRGIRVDFVPHRNGEDVLIITRRRDGLFESSWGFPESVGFHRSGGMKETDEPMPEEARAIMDRRIGEADDWPAPVRR